MKNYFTDIQSEVRMCSCYKSKPLMIGHPLLYLLLLNFMLLFLLSCNGTPVVEKSTSAKQQHIDTSFLQDFSIKYYLADTNITLKKVYCDRNGVIQILSSDGLLTSRNGQFLFPGTLVRAGHYRTLADKNITAINLYQEQFIYADDQAVLSNAWAGKLFDKHSLPGAHILVPGRDFTFVLANDQSYQLIKDAKIEWTAEKQQDQILAIKFDPGTELFWILTATSLSTFSPENNEIKKVFTGTDFNCFEMVKNGREVVIGTTNGFLRLDAKTKQPIDQIQQNLPVMDITCINEIDGKIWFGSSQGAFMLREDGRFNYYHGERWLPSNQVNHIAKGEGQSVLILTNAGLGVIHLKKMTLHDKAQFYEKQVRDRHIRLGFNASLSRMDHGDITSGILVDSDNDGLWTSMYLGGQVFRYAVTQSEEALQNCRESLDAMERLYSINPVPGFPSRSFERRGYKEILADPVRWQHAEDPEWDWKATTSSDEAIGHIFAFGVMAELIDDEDLKSRAIQLMDTLMQHIVDNDFYLVDFDGKPTTWGRWNPEYVNARPTMVGDRKLNSSNIIGMLQTAYHFTQKEIYKTKAFELMDQHGYLENLMRPISEIGPAPEDADDWSKMLSEEWNHSDDEMYFLGYWGLYRYAFNDSLKAKYKAAIIDHWDIERPEKEGAWNIFTAMAGADSFDLEEAIWYLQEYPLDLITWEVQNSHRQDIEKIAPNFRNQTTKDVLPPDELRIARHNANRFRLDGGDQGRTEYSAGDIWLLPYWMGRYFEVISAPN